MDIDLKNYWLNGQPHQEQVKKQTKLITLNIGETVTLIEGSGSNFVKVIVADHCLPCDGSGWVSSQDRDSILCEDCLGKGYTTNEVIIYGE